MTGTATDAPAASTAAALAGLRAWLSGITTDITTATPDGQGKPRLCIWPVALLPDQETRGGSARTRLRMRVRYLVGAAGPIDPAVALIDQVLTALANQDRYRLVLEPVHTSLAGQPPQPAVFIDIPVLVPVTPADSAPRVTGELHLTGGPVRSIHGSVLGPGDVALAGMTIASPATGTSAHTDARGAFHLPGQPGARAVVLHLSGRGLHLQVEVAPQTTGPVIVHCPIEEV